MGLRINTNISSVSALRNLQISDRAQQQSLERLSTGLRINSAADDPSGLVISERLRAQINALEQAQQNTQRGANLIRTADSALQEAENLLSDIKESLIFALNKGTGDLDQLQAEQDSLDSAIEAVDRIAQTTRFAGTPLLNGNQSFNVTSTVSDVLNDLTIREMEFPQGVSQQTFDFELIQSAQRGFLSIGSATGSSEAVVISGDVTLRVSGPRGSKDVIITESSTAGEVRDALNNISGATGVFGSIPTGSAAGGSNILALTEEFGTDQQVKIEVIDSESNGAIFLDGSMKGEGETVTDQGIDPEINVNGQEFTGNGRNFKIVSTFGNFEFDLDSNTDVDGVFTSNIDASEFQSGGASGIPTFEVRSSGLQFQLNESAQLSDRIRIGIESVLTVQQGFEEIPDVVARSQAGDDSIFKGGFLNSLQSGGENDLETNPENALNIVDNAINQLSRLRGHLGAIDAFNFQPNNDHLGVAIENLKSSESSIRDLDFAAESANFAKNQVQFQAGTAVLASANSIPQSVLSLLQ